MATKQFWYLDTVYLISYIHRYIKNKIAQNLVDREQSNIARRVIGKIKPENIKVPVIVWGEVLTQLKEKQVDLGVMSLTSDFETAWLRRNETKTFSKIVHDLAEKEMRLEPFDCLITAFAIASSECCGLLTFDSHLIGNVAIKEIIDEIGRSGTFTIIEEP